MKIYNSNGVEILDVEVDDNSLRNRVIMGDHNLTLHYSLAVHVELPVGSYCTFEGVTYTLKRPENLKMKHSRNFEYTVLLESPQADTKIWKFRNTVDGRLKFPLTAKPHEHLQMLVDNLNRRGSGWTVGDCVDDVEHLINYDHDYCWEALGKMATEFSTEFEIDNKRVSLKKVEYNKSAPLALSYGKGHGFRTGVARSSSETPPVEFLFVQGGSENIDRSKYGSDRAANGSPVLLLPKSKTIKYDGEHFEDEQGYDASKARTYSTDNYGLCIFRTDKAHTSYAEDSLDCSDVCPKRVGTVSSVVTVDAEHNFYDIVDASIPDGLDYSACQIEGEKLTIIFQSGMLAGHGEFEVNYFHTAVNGKAAKRFEIVPKDEDGITMPNATFKPVGGVNGDKYAVFKCMLPDAYICDNNTKSGAEWDMFRTAVKYMYAHEEEEFSFKGELDSIWASQDWANIGAKIILGGYVQFSDTRFQPNGVLVRITGIKDYINKPHKPEIELSNKTVTAGFASEIKQIESQEVITEEYHRDALDFTKRRFRDAKETMDMLNDLIEAGFDNFTGNINPITVQTMQMLVGDESLQYRFVNNTTNPSTVNHTFSWNNATKKLSTAAGIIQHMTIGIKNLSSTHSASEYKYWSVSAFESAALTDGSKKYYLYIKASKTEATAVFLLSETAIRIEQVTGYYHFLVGVLNSEYEDGRSFVTLYGFSEILPGRITTDRVVSSSGTSFFDLVANALKLGDKLDFNTAGDGKLVLKGTLVQSLDGETEQPVGCYRGQWDEELMYYYGDEVWYNSNGVISYYRYINQTPTMGNDPTNTDYWQVLAAGVRGFFKARAFMRTNTDISNVTPLGGTYDSPVPTSGWSDGIPSGTAILWSTVCTFYSNGTSSGWSHPVKETDTDTLDIEFSPSSTQPSAPSGSTPFADHESEGWYDPNSENFPTAGTMIWRAERKVKNGVYNGEWVITRIYGETGDTGQSTYKSTMFVRMNSTPTKPASNKGSYSTPSPSLCLAGQNSDGNNVYWSDGIPAGQNKLWATTRIFTSDGREPQQSAWTDPRQMTDTMTYDVEFAPMQANDAAPAVPSSSNRHKDASPYGYEGQVWFDPDLDKYSAQGVSRDFKVMYWRAERVCENGKWGDWVINRIKGEAGNNGRSITGVTEYYLASANASGVTRETSGWQSGTVPPIDANTPYLWNYEEIAYSSGNQTKTDPAVIGVFGEDGASITGVTEYYLASSQYSGITRNTTGWTTDPTATAAKITSVKKYLWNYEKIELSKGDPKYTTPVIIGAYGDTGVGLFKATAFIRLPSIVTSVNAPTGGDWSSPVPTSSVVVSELHASFNWSDSIPSGDTTLWATTRTFYSDGTASSWSTPRKMTDTTTYDVEFAKKQTNDATPATPTSANRHGGSGTQIWFDPVNDSTEDFTQMYWRAEREYKNGEWGSWVITRIKGEKGDDAEFYQLEVSSQTVKRDGNTMTPGTVVWKLIHIQGDTREEVSALPTGWYMKRTRSGTGGTATGSAFTTIPYSIVTGTLFGWNGDYNNARVDLYDENDHIISSADVSLVKDGDDGINGNYFEYRYAVNGSPTSYPSISRSSRTPSGWSKSPSSPSALQYLWMTVAEINGETDALVDQWSEPVRHTPLDGISMGENLVDNSEEAEVFAVVECGLTQDSTLPQKFYATNKRLCRIPADGTVLSGQVRITLTGCSFKSGGAQVLVYLDGYAAWPYIGEKLSITANGTYDLKTEGVTYGYNGGTMYKPIMIRLRNFNDGGTITVERVKVEVGNRCSSWSLSEADKRGPAILYQGVYDGTSTYYGTHDRIDCVKYNDVYYAARSDAGVFAGIAPTNTDYWNEFGGQFSSVATQLLLAEFAYIENLGVRNLLTSDSGKRVHVSKDENALSIYDDNNNVAVVLSGDEYSDGELFGGTEESLSPTSFSGSYQAGSALHPDTLYTSSFTTNKSFTVTKAGVLSGSVSLNISCIGTYSLSDGSGQLKPTRRAYAQVEVYLDNTMLGSCSIADLKPDLGGNSPSCSATISINKNLTIGSHVLKTRVKISNPNYATANYAVSASSSFSSVKVKYDIRKSHYFANGNALGCSSTQYSETIIQNSAILHKVRSGNAGMEINGGTFKILLGGTWYTASMTTISGEKVLKLTNV